jgi:hypothetical protein
MRMTTPIDTARGLIGRHGLQAAAVASEHASQSQARGDSDGARRWCAVLRYVNELRAEARQAAAH